MKMRMEDKDEAYVNLSLPTPSFPALFSFPFSLFFFLIFVFFFSEQHGCKANGPGVWKLLVQITSIL